MDCIFNEDEINLVYLPHLLQFPYVKLTCSTCLTSGKVYSILRLCITHVQHHDQFDRITHILTVLCLYLLSSICIGLISNDGSHLNIKQQFKNTSRLLLLVISIMNEDWPRKGLHDCMIVQCHIVTKFCFMCIVFYQNGWSFLFNS